MEKENPAVHTALYFPFFINKLQDNIKFLLHTSKASPQLSINDRLWIIEMVSTFFKGCVNVFHVTFDLSSTI